MLSLPLDLFRDANFERGLLSADAIFPVHYKGRLRPPQAYATVWAQDHASEKIPALDIFLQLTHSEIENQEKEMAYFIKNLEAQHYTPSVIAQLVENRYPLQERLKAAGTLWTVLPSAHKDEWFSLNALKVKIYSIKQQQLIPVNNFTRFSDDIFIQIQTAVLNHSLKEHLSEVLAQAYRSLAGKTYQTGSYSSLHYPSYSQLLLEEWYYRYPLLPIALFLYALSMCGLILSGYYPRLYCFATSFLFLSFIWHSLLLMIRCWILARPPVSNMFETIIYVPWIAMGLSLILYRWMRHRTILIAGGLTTLLLLSLLELTQLNQHLENVQPVLNSQLWLTIHVLMVVGSYGAFALASVLGHFYLSLYNYLQIETTGMKVIAQSLLQALYIGIILLICGTFLGGVWAAESWGRFWDWDPKEAWAFISSCIYLAWIHAYRFGKISYVGLALGAVIGFLAISFTWYGVNYILGTGFHSYGFGSGGEISYYTFLLIESLFILYCLKNYYIQNINKHKNQQIN